METLAAYNARARKKAAIENQITLNPTRRGPDVELATLRQLPTRHSTNILYNQASLFLHLKIFEELGKSIPIHTCCW